LALVTLRELSKDLSLKVIAGEKGLKKTIKIPEVNRASLILTGYTKHFEEACRYIQVLGNTELSYLQTLSPSTRKKRVFKLTQYPVPCFILTRGLLPPPELVERCNSKNIPLFSTPLSTNTFIVKLVIYLEDRFAPEITVPGVLVDVFGSGILIQGESGVGKSECALELIERGHRLVADDLVKIKRKPGNILQGSPAGPLRFHMEVRGLGIIDVLSLFGIGAVRNQKHIDFLAELVEWDPKKEYDRTGTKEEKITILGVELPKITIPIRPGRNLAVILETAAMNQRLKRAGYHTSEEFNQKLKQELLRKRRNKK